LEVVDQVRGSVARAIIVPPPGVEWSGLVEALPQHLTRELASTKCPREIQLVADDNGRFTPR
jgi:hypothetical protein